MVRVFESNDVSVMVFWYVVFWYFFLVFNTNFVDLHIFFIHTYIHTYIHVYTYSHTVYIHIYTCHHHTGFYGDPCC
jgi:hypothetical protein